MPKCTHIYDQATSHNHGFADFMKGSICLFQYCKKYKYSFYIDKNAHPIFKYLKDNKYYSHESSKESPFVLKIGSHPSKNHEVLKNLFQSNTDINIFTNSLYLATDGSVVGFGDVWPELSVEDKEFARTILQPNEYLSERINKVFNEKYQIDNNFSYEVIHLRFSDSELNVKTRNSIRDYDVNVIIKKIKDVLVNNVEKLHILVCSSKKTGNFIKEELSEHSNLKYWDNEKVHTGYFGNVRDDEGERVKYEKTTIDNDQSIIDTLIDFFTITKSSGIRYFSAYVNGTGFSGLASKVFDINTKKLC